MNIVTTGSRDFTDEAAAFAALDTLHKTRGPITRIAHGAYRGWDSIAKRWAQARGIHEQPYFANWDQFHGAAGPIRNSEMLRAEKPDYVIAGPGGEGTADCVRKAKRAGIPVEYVCGATEEQFT